MIQRIDYFVYFQMGIEIEIRITIYPRDFVCGGYNKSIDNLFVWFYLLYLL